MEKIVIIDGNSLLFRAYYATSYNGGPLLQTSFGVHTNAIVAFSNMLTNILKTIKIGDGLFVAFDKGSNTFRHKQYSEYKANRTAAPEELKEQFPIARELLSSLNIPFFETDNIEADDIAGIMSKKASKQNIKVEIYTSDHDYFQLIDNNITIKLIKKGLQDIHDLDLKTFKDEYGIEPIQITDYKGLLGDSSDNIPGIPKVGEKTALTLIKQYGDIEKIIEACKSLKTKVAESIVTNQEIGRLSKDLATIRVDENITFEIEDTIYKGYELEKINSFSTKYELRKLISRLPTELLKKDELKKEIEYIEIDSNFKEKLDSKIGIAIDIENINYHNAKLYGISLTSNEKTYYINLENLLHNQYLLEILKDDNFEKYVFSSKEILVVFNNHNIQINNIAFDLTLANYLIDSSSNNDFQSIMMSNNINVSNAYSTSENSLFNFGNIKLTSYISYYCLNISSKLLVSLKEKEQIDLLYEIEMPLAKILAEIEIEGFPVDKEILISNKHQYEEKIKELEQQIFQYSGEEFNVSSPKQLSKILFEKLKLNSNKKGSTSYEYLKELIDKHPIINLILEHRKYSKLINQYVDGIIPFIGNDNKIHATFNQSITTTGRLSSSEPNLQNISVRDEDAKLIRKAYRYNDDNLYIMSLDYSQIELRVLAHLSKCEGLINIFNKGEDIHSGTAKRVFKLDREPTENERRIAKAVNFGIVYGISDWGLSEQINTSVSEAQNIISNFHNEFKEVSIYMAKQVDFVKTHEYSLTLFNRRRYLTEINDPSFQTREFAKRAAMNAPIQGTAADLIKIAMIKIHDALKNYKSCLISQIHDELIFKVYEDEKDEVLNIAKNVMENCINLDVPLKVDGGYAKTWFDAK